MLPYLFEQLALSSATLDGAEELKPLYSRICVPCTLNAVLLMHGCSVGVNEPNEPRSPSTSFRASQHICRSSPIITVDEINMCLSEYFTTHCTTKVVLQYGSTQNC
jgi:hypothetical protein